MPAKTPKAIGSLSPRGRDVLDATERLLERRDTDDLSMATIAAECGITRTAIYRLFKSPGEIFESLSNLFIAQSYEHTLAFVRGRAPATLRELLFDVVDAMVEFYNGHVPAAKLHLLARAQTDFRSIDANFARRGSQVYLELLRDSAGRIPDAVDAEAFETIVILQAAFFSESVRRHGHIDERSVAQAKQLLRLLARLIGRRRTAGGALDPAVPTEHARLKAASAAILRADDCALSACAADQLAALLHFRERPGSR